MNKKAIVRLTDQERQICREVVKKLKGHAQKVRRANILLMADADGPARKDEEIAEAYHCSVQTVENARKRCVQDGFEVALNGKKRETPPSLRKLDGEGEAKLIALSLGPPPSGYARWTLRLLGDRLVESRMVKSICRETLCLYPRIKTG